MIFWNYWQACDHSFDFGCIHLRKRNFKLEKETNKQAFLWFDNTEFEREKPFKCHALPL